MSPGCVEVRNLTPGARREGTACETRLQGGLSRDSAGVNPVVAYRAYEPFLNGAR